VSAGHINSLIVSSSGTVVALGSTGAPLGLLPPGMPYDATAIDLHEGDCLVLCSDGVPDAQNEAGDEWGEGRLTALLQDSRNEPSAAIVAKVFEAIDAFAGAAPQFDDITLIVLRRLPDPSA
jgi:sigma-B regulation protein RsbU (phosphoserine phosphatase)